MKRTCAHTSRTCVWSPLPLSAMERERDRDAVPRCANRRNLCLAPLGDAQTCDCANQPGRATGHLNHKDSKITKFHQKTFRTWCDLVSLESWWFKPLIGIPQGPDHRETDRLSVFSGAASRGSGEEGGSSYGGGSSEPASKPAAPSKKKDDVVIEDVGDEPINLDDIPF